MTLPSLDCAAAGSATTSASAAAKGGERTLMGRLVAADFGAGAGRRRSRSSSRVRRAAPARGPRSRGKPRAAPLLVVQAELLDLARDRVATDAELVRRLDATTAGQLERGADQLRLELARQRLPDHR